LIISRELALDEASTSGDVVQETDGNGVTQASYVLGDDELFAQTRSGAVSYYLEDGQGSVRLLTDANGAITDSYTYDAFGNTLTSQGTTVNPYRYTGQQLDSLTGLYDLRARYYDPTSGRFLSRDTASLDFSNPVELNRYSYAEENPVNLRDPSGHGDDELEYGLANTIVFSVGRGVLKVLAGVLSARILIALLLLLFLSAPGVLTNIQGLVESLTQTQQKQKDSHPDEVLLDNNALSNWKAVTAITKDEPNSLLRGQDPVVIATVLFERQRPLPDSRIHWVEPDFDFFTLIELNEIHDIVQPDKNHWADATIGATMLKTDRGLITFDHTFCATMVLYDLKHVLTSDVTVFRPQGLRPISDLCKKVAFQNINKIDALP